MYRLHGHDRLMGLLEHNQEILKRMRDLRPVEPQLRRIFVEGKKRQLERGVDARGVAFAPLARSTQEHRAGQGPPLAPQGPNSAIVTTYRVTFEQTVNGLTMVASWPLAWIKYHVAGGRRLPRRDPTGFRPEDKAEAMRVVQDYVMRGRT